MPCNRVSDGLVRHHSGSGVGEALGVGAGLDEVGTEGEPVDDLRRVLVGRTAVPGQRDRHRSPGRRLESARILDCRVPVRSHPAAMGGRGNAVNEPGKVGCSVGVVGAARRREDQREVVEFDALAQ